MSCRCTPRPPLWLFRVSYHWYPVVGVVVSLAASTVASLLCRCREDVAVDPRLFSPAIRRFLRRRPDTDSKAKVGWKGAVFWRCVARVRFACLSCVRVVNVFQAPQPTADFPKGIKESTL